MFTNVGYTPAQNPTYTVKTIGGKPTLVPAHFDNPTAAATSFVKERGCDPSKAKAAKQNEESWFTSLSKNVGKWWQENQQAITVGVTGIAIGMAIATVLSAGAAAPLLAATIATALGTTAATGATLATLALAGVATAGGVSITTGAMSIGSTIPSENNVLKPVVNSPTFQVVQGGSILVSTLGTATLAPYAQMGQQAKQEQAATNNTKPAAGQVSEGGTASGAGANRAAKFAENWQQSSLDDAIEKFAPNAKPVTTSSGKTLFKNEGTGIQVVYDKSGNYFRIEDTTLAGKRRYLDLNGNNVSNKIVDGKQMGRTKDEYEAITHFLNTK